MAVRHGWNWPGLGLRLCGLVLCGIAYVAFAQLLDRAHVRAVGGADFPSLALAATGFLCASAGSAMACLGHHLFDRIEVSSRWTRGGPRANPE